MKKVTVSAGHSLKGVDYGAVDLIDESVEARKITKAVVKYLKELGVQAWNCTDDETKTGSVSGHLAEICARHNAHDADLAVSIHLNAAGKSHKKDGKNLGTEVYVNKNKTGKKYEAATAICNALHKLGFTNRGRKVRDDLYFLNHTNDPALLVEVCFVTDADDVALYKKQGADKIGKAIAEAIAKAI